MMEKNPSQMIWIFFLFSILLEPISLKCRCRISKRICTHCNCIPAHFTIEKSELMQLGFQAERERVLSHELQI